MKFCFPCFLLDELVNQFNDCQPKFMAVAAAQLETAKQALEEYKGFKVSK